MPIVELPLLETVFDAVQTYLNSFDGNDAPPIFIHLDTSGIFHDPQVFESLSKICKDAFGDKLDCPFLDRATPPRLREFMNKVCLASPNEELASVCQFQVISIGDLNCLLTANKPQSAEEYYKLVQRKVLALSTQETLSFVGGLSQVCEQMFVTVVPVFEHKDKRRSSLLVKSSTQHLTISKEALQESELHSADTIKVERKASSGIVFDSQMATFSPARAWKSGVQSIPITAKTSNENYLQEDCIFKQNKSIGFVPIKAPRLHHEPPGNFCELKIELGKFSFTPSKTTKFY